MYFQYGSYAHTAGTVNLVSHAKRSLYNARGYSSIVLESLTIDGFITGSTQAAIDTAIAAVEAAYAEDGKDAGLYTDAGAATIHFLDSSNSLGGVRVTNVAFNDSDGSQFATQRSFTITLEAEFVGGSDGLESWQQTIRVVGTGGPRGTVVETLTGPPQIQRLAARTAVLATQSGSAVGLLAYPKYPAPLWPAVEQLDRREQSKASPQNVRGSFRNWPISWSYSFLSPTPLGGNPGRK